LLAIPFNSSFVGKFHWIPTFPFLACMTGWWFGTWMDYFCHHIGNVIIPTDELIFFRGVGWNHQPVSNYQYDSPSLTTINNY
jgi:hypothetical protein